MVVTWWVCSICSFVWIQRLLCHEFLYFFLVTGVITLKVSILTLKRKKMNKSTKNERGRTKLNIWFVVHSLVSCSTEETVNEYNYCGKQRQPKEENRSVQANKMKMRKVSFWTWIHTLYSKLKIFSSCSTIHANVGLFNGFSCQQDFINLYLQIQLEISQILICLLTTFQEIDCLKMTKVEKTLQIVL